MIDLLTPIFKGKWAPFAEGLACHDTSDTQAYRIADLLEAPHELENILIRRSHFLAYGDLRPIAAVWLLKYVTLLVPPVAAAATVLQRRLPVGPADISLVLDIDAAPLKFVIPHTGENMPDLDVQHRYDLLLHEHLNPLITLLSALARVPKKILWGNVSRRLETTLGLAQQLEGYPANVAQRASDDKAFLLERPTWPDGGRNPMFGKKRKATRMTMDGEEVVYLHRQCCLKYLLPEGGYCGVCPLSPEFIKKKGSTAQV